MNLTTQILAATGMGLRSVPHRIGSSLVIVIGIAGVVCVLASVLAMSSGFGRAIQGEARQDRVLLLTRGVESEGASRLSRENIATLQAAAGIRRDTQGKPILSAEVVLVAPVSRKSSGTDAYLTLRGVGDQHQQVRPEIKLVSGRMFQAGVHELIVGEAARAQFAGLEVGERVRLHDGDWAVVGVFEGGDNVRESEVIADAGTVMAAYQMTTFNSATALLVDTGSLAAVKDAVSLERSLDADVIPEPQYLAAVSGDIHRQLRLVAYVIGAIMALGALCGALNTMYSAVASRMRELATLRALGFGSCSLIAATLIEGLLLALAGASAGVAVAYLAFNGQTISTLGGSRWDSQIVYSLAVTPSIMIVATLLACGIGLLGSLFPALRAVRVPVADALRAI